MNIFLDDVRKPYDVTWVVMPKLPEGETWVIVRSHAEFVDLLEQVADEDGCVERVSFDHDLSEEHYPGREDYSAGNTGYDCALALAHYIIDNDWPMPEYVVHSLNPCAKDRIDAAMNDVLIFRERFAGE